jgi:hypothetical protein
MEKIADNQLGFVLHPVQGEGQNLDAGVFSQKFAQLLRALAAADAALNGRRANSYEIARLKSSSPTVVLSERQIDRQLNLVDSPKSSVAGFRNCAAAIVEGDVRTAQAYGDCARRIARLSAVTSGRSRGFGFGEIWGGSGDVIRIDSFLSRRADEATRGEAPLHPGAPIEPLKWFRGVVDGTFDGELQAVDLRGAVPECALVVGPGHEIDCIFRESSLAQIGTALTSRSRVRLTGRAIYDGRSGLPARLEIRDIELVSSDVDFLKWKGAFEPFSPDEWEDDAP